MLSNRYENTERRKAQVAEKGLLYLGMGVSGGEEGARNGEGLRSRSPVMKVPIFIVHNFIDINI